MNISEYTATILWSRDPAEDYLARQYSRLHTWRFDGGISVPASPSPHVVAAPYSSEKAVDPEEAFVASLSSCHMLFFLELAAKKRWIVDSYTDNAVGIMQDNGSGKTAITDVTLRPKATFSGDKLPTVVEIEKLHHLAHEKCFIANSVKTNIHIEIIAP